MGYSLIRILIFVILSLGFRAQARSLQCESVFAPTLPEVLHSLNQEARGFLLKGSLDGHFQQSTWLQKRALRKLINQFDLKSFASARAVQEYATELSILLYGRRDTVDYWLKQDRASRQEFIFKTSLQETLLRQGLEKTWAESFRIEDHSLAKRALDKVWGVLNSKALRVAQIPFRLPTIHNKEVPPDLIFKVLRDGMEPHGAEIQNFVQAQSRRDAYNTFARLYGPVVVGTLLVTHMQTAYQALEQEHQRHLQTLLENLRQQQKELPQQVADFKEQQISWAIAESLKEFKMKWGEEPTSEERALIEKKIREALK